MKWRQGIIQCENAIREGMLALLQDCRFLSLEEACSIEESQPVLQYDDLSFYSPDVDSAIVFFHPWGIYSAAAAVNRDIDSIIIECRELLEDCSPYFGEHPDLFLSDHVSHRRIICLYVRRRKSDHARMRRLTMELLLIGEPVHVYEDRDCLSILWADQEDENTLKNRCGDILARFGACAGLSGPFDLSISARGLMTKARLAAEQGESSGLVSFDSVQWSLFWRQADRVMEKAGHSPADFCHPAITQLARNDREHGTDYMNSLSAYLRSGRRLREASRSLGVHRNTLDYRIRRISDLFGIDTESASTCFELLFSIQLLERYGEHALSQLVENDVFSRPQVQSLLWAGLEGQTSTANIRGRCRLLLIHIGSQSEDRLRQTLDMVRVTFPESIVAFNDDAVCLALSGDEEGDVMELAGNILNEMELNGVITPLFPLDEIGRRLNLLLMFLPTIHTLGVSGGMLPVQEHLSDLFFFLLQSQTNLSPYYSEQVIRVMDLDYEKNSNLSGSLYVYLTNFMDMNDAASAARIHRNTLEYHLKKIVPLIGGMPGEQLRFEMICTYRMLLMSTPD